MKIPFAFPLLLAPVLGEVASPGLVDPATQPKFQVLVPNPLDPSFVYETSTGSIDITVSKGESLTGLVDSQGLPLSTPIWGYGTPEQGYTWPGRTFEVRQEETIRVTWHNKIPIEDGYLITGKDNGELGDFTGQSVVDTSYHWAYSIPGYEGYSIEEHGTPIVPHLHGGHTDESSDGNPEFFFSPDWGVTGPHWVQETYVYPNDQKATMLWYHDHALGITRLNVYAGLAGLYIIRDLLDTGRADNPLNLPALPYEIPLIVQDRMFKENGELFYPAFNGDPFYKDFIQDEGAHPRSDDDPSALAEFFGDVMLVNGKIWPKMIVAPRNYRLRLLNACDSRFMVIQFVAVPPGQTNFTLASEPLEFTVIGGDQGLAMEPVTIDTFVWEPSARYDIIFNFTDHLGQRIIMKNIGGDEPFGGDIPGPVAFEFTDRIMAFDVQEESIAIDFRAGVAPDDFDPSVINFPKVQRRVDRVRKLGLFEGHDQFGRLQPLLGTVEPATDKDGNPINWPDTQEYRDVGLVGQMEGTMTWHAPTTENIRLYDTEDWEIWNLSADAHPIHIHLIELELVRRNHIVFDSNSVDGEIEPDETPAGDGTYTIDRVLVQHDGSIGEGYKAVNPTMGNQIPLSSLLISEYLNNVPRDVITALPGQVTTVRIYFDKPGRYNWHCHILSHEDHEMMRNYHVGDLPEDQKPWSDQEMKNDGSGARPSGRAAVLLVTALVSTVWFNA